MSKLSIALALFVPTFPSLTHAGAPVRGIVIDEVDGAALAHYKLELRAGEQAELVTSDAQGRFRTSAAFEAGELLVQPIDHDALQRSTFLGRNEVARMIVAPKKLAFDPSREMTVAVMVGPTYRVKLAPLPAELPAGAFARLRAEPPPGSGDVWSVVAPLRTEGGGVWARFDSYPKYLAQAAARWTLAIETPNGLWSGAAPVLSIRGAHASVLEIAMTERTRWAGTLRNSKGIAVPFVPLALERLGETGQPLETWTEVSDTEGAYAFSNLVPGTYRLSGSPLRYRDFESQPKTLAALAEGKLDVMLDPHQPAGAIAGVLRSRSGTFSAQAGHVVLALRRAGKPHVFERQTPEWIEADGKRTAVFSFDDLPKGEYEIDVRAPPPTTFEPLTLAAVPGACDLTFVVQD